MKDIEISKGIYKSKFDIYISPYPSSNTQLKEAKVMSRVMSKREKLIRQKTLNTANTIREKYLSLKLELSGKEDELNKILNPIKVPLTKIVENTCMDKVKIEMGGEGEKVLDEKERN